MIKAANCAKSQDIQLAFNLYYLTRKKYKWILLNMNENADRAIIHNRNDHISI